MNQTELFVLYVRDNPPDIGDDLPDGYSFVVWTPTIRHPVPATMGWKSAAWTLFHWCGLFANRGYCIVFIRHGDRLVHRSCVLPRYFRWPFMGNDDLQISSTWTQPEFRGKGLASVALAHIVQTMKAAHRRFWYVTREANLSSIRVCRRVGFELLAYGRRDRFLGLRILGQLNLMGPSNLEAKQQLNVEVGQSSWYDRYYSKYGADRNDIRVNRGTLFQVLASERSLICAAHHITLELGDINVLDVGCGSGGSWYQLFRLGVKPEKMVGIDVQLERLDRVRDLYPQSSTIHGDAVSLPFANASFDLVWESTLFATLPDDHVRAGIAAEMLRTCKPNGYLLLVDWRMPKFGDRYYKALTRAEVRRLFGVGQISSLVGVFHGALAPPLGRLLSAYAEPIYFLVAGLCPPLVAQVAYLLRRNPDPTFKS